MNNPTFNLNLSIFDERDNLPIDNSFVEGNMNIQTNFQYNETTTRELKRDTVADQGSSTDVFSSFFKEFPFMDELFTPFDESEKPTENQTTNSDEHQDEHQDKKTIDNIDSRHSRLDEEGLNAFSAANSEKNTKYSTTWAAKTFKGKLIKFFSYSHTL